MFQQSAEALIQAAQAATDNDELACGIEAIYRSASAAIAARLPACRQCARCCRFEQYGHNLFVSTAEAAYFLRRTSLSRIDEPIEEACPFLRTHPPRCAARAARPLGCRLYYCDPSAQWWQQDLYSRLHGRLQALHGRHGLPYHYAEWLAVLRAAAAARVS